MGYTLSSIVEELLIEMGEGQSNKFARYYQYGVSFLRQKHFTTTGVPKMVELTISSTDTAPLPADYVNYTKIGLCVNGRIISLGLNNDICSNPSYDDCGNSTVASNSTTGSGVYLGDVGDRVGDHYTNGENMGRFFGIGADNNCLGYYKIDKSANVIKFSQLAQTTNIVMEYLADINAIDGDFEVHPFVIEALKDWMFWKYKQRSSKTLGEQQLAHENYKKSFRLMQHMIRSGTADEWIAVFQSGDSATPIL